MRLRESSRPGLRAPTAKVGVAARMVLVASLLTLSGCQAIKGIFEVGFGLGALVVLAVVAIVGGIIAVVSRK